MNRIRAYRQHLPEMEKMKDEVKNLKLLIEANPDPEEQMNIDMKQEIKDLQSKIRAISSYKAGLPMLMYQASGFDVSLSRNGNLGRWRKQSAVHLNGLFMLDIDHVDDPVALFRSWCAATPLQSEEDLCAATPLPSKGRGRGGVSDFDSAENDEGMTGAVKEITDPTPTPPLEGEGSGCAQNTSGGSGYESKEAFCKEHGILLVHITPSGKGLRIVAIADPKVGNIADNQEALATKLGVEKDKACKDASRCSFCPMLEDILYINSPKLFNYENKEYDAQFGHQYRGGNSQPSINNHHHPNNVRGLSSAPANIGGGVDMPQTGQVM